MANRTDPHADTVHGTNPQFLVDRIVRVKIYNDAYWKEFCFGLTTESVIDQAAKLDYVGGTYGGRRRPAKFLCLFLKLLQIQPDEDVVLEYIRQPELKYLRALGCMYLRITARYPTILNTLEPLYADYRKLRHRDMMGKVSMIHMDEWIDQLLKDETVCDVTMPQMPKRELLESAEVVQPYQSVLEDDLEDLEELERSVQEAQALRENSDAAAKAEALREAGLAPQPPAEAATEEKPPSKEQEPQAEKDKEKGKDRDREKDKERPRSREREMDSERRRRSRSRRCSRSRSVRRGGRDARRSERSASRRQDRSDSGRARRQKNEAKEAKMAKEKERPKEKEKEKPKEKVKEKEKEKEREPEKKEKKDKKDKKDKKEKTKYANKADEERATGHSKKDKDGLSVDEWNELRKGMGLKPLQK